MKSIIKLIVLIDRIQENKTDPGIYSTATQKMRIKAEMIPFIINKDVDIIELEKKLESLKKLLIIEAGDG